MAQPAVRHVVLVGLMGSGKTTVGRRLANRLGRDFVDADEALEAITERSIAELFETGGEVAFRALEADVLEELLEHHEATVVAAGGGVVLDAGSRARLRRSAVTTVWLDASPAFLASRVKPKAHRPLLSVGSPHDVLARLHAERAPLYAEVADLTVDVEPFHRAGDRPKERLADELARLVADHEARVPA